MKILLKCVTKIGYLNRYKNIYIRFKFSENFDSCLAMLRGKQLGELGPHDGGGGTGVTEGQMLGARVDHVSHRAHQGHVSRLPQVTSHVSSKLANNC